MLAYRTTWLVKQGQMVKALQLLVAEGERVKHKGIVIHVYTPEISPWVLVFEEIVENVEAHDKWWAEYNQDPKAPAFWAKWDEVVERSLGTERWNLTEFG